METLATSTPFQQNVRGKYVQENLTRGEGVVYEATVSWVPFVPGLILAGLLSFFIVGIPVLIYVIAVRRNIELALTNNRVMAKSGVFRRTTIEMNLNRVESVQIHQGLLGRILNYGSLVVSGAGNPQERIRAIKDPLTFRRVLLETQESMAGFTRLPN